MRRLLLAAPLLLAGALAIPAFAQSGGHSHDHDHDHPPVYKAPARGHANGLGHDESEASFAFLGGSDIGERGERHLGLSFDAAFGKRGGTFFALRPAVELGYNVTDRLHIALELWGDYFRVRNNPDFADQNRWGGGLAVEFKAVLLKRGKHSPVGVAFLLAPHYSNSEDVSGEPATHFALETRLIFDVELVRERLFAAFNLLYEPERVRPRGGPWEKESLLGLLAGLTAQLSPTVAAGAELQYFRKYEGYFFETLAGHALYVGPALHWKLGEHATASFGWAVQVAGKAAGSSRALDLVNFERHRITWSIETHF
jgi:hypothetical protein